MQKQLHIAVLSGGTSGERAISLLSGASVLKALIASGYDAENIVLDSQTINREQLAAYDVLFPVLHGTFGEDGGLQKQLEDYGFRYVGSDSKASNLCFDKSAYKLLLSKEGISLPKDALVTKETVRDHPLTKAAFVLKPIASGSSIDTFIVRDVSKAPWDKIMATIPNYDEMLLEQLIEGCEITVGVLGQQALPVVEIVPPEGQEFDYENKYNGTSQELCPAQSVSADVQAVAQQLALQIHQLTGCRHYSRTDMIVQPDGTVVVLETNTLPGFTEESLLPKAAAVAGYPMPKFVDQLVQLATQ